MRTRLGIRLYTIAAACLATATIMSGYDRPAMADTASLLKPANAQEAAATGGLHRLHARRGVVAVTPVEVDLGALAGSTLTIPLGDGKPPAVFTGGRQRFVDEENFDWVGHIEDQPGDIVLVAHNGRLTGMMHVGNRAFELEPVSGRVHALMEFDLNKLPQQDVVVRDRPAKPSKMTKHAPPALRGDAPANGYVEIDVMVGYTPELKASVGDIEAKARAVIAETNDTYTSSKIGVRLKLVDLFEHGHENKDIASLLGSFKKDTWVNKHRDNVGADLAVLLVKDGGDKCGVAQSYSDGNPDKAYAVVSTACILEYTFAHEIGHLQGASHNPEAEQADVPFEDGHGYLFLKGAPIYRTIMSYSCPYNPLCIPIGYWSDPNEKYMGLTRGDNTCCNSVSVLNRTAATIAGYKSQKVTTTKSIAAAANTNGSLVVAAVRDDGTPVYKTRTSDGWGNWMRLGNGVAKSMAAGRHADGRLEFFHIGTNDGLWHISQINPNGGWREWEQVGVNRSFKSVQVGNLADGRIALVAIGNAGGVMFNQEKKNGDWDEWNRIGDLTAKDVRLANNADGRLEVVAIRESDNAIVHTFQRSGGEGWDSWSELGPGGKGKALAMGKNRDGRLEVFMAGLGNEVWHIFQHSPNGEWSQWHPIGDAKVTNLIVANNQDGRPELVATSTNSNYTLHTWRQSNNEWHSWVQLGNGNSKENVILINNDGRLEVFQRGMNDRVYHIFQNQPNVGWSEWEEL